MGVSGGWSRHRPPGVAASKANSEEAAQVDLDRRRCSAGQVARAAAPVPAVLAALVGG
jgi:hypothetical protein